MAGELPKELRGGAGAHVVATAAVDACAGCVVGARPVTLAASRVSTIGAANTSTFSQIPARLHSGMAPFLPYDFYGSALVPKALNFLPIAALRAPSIRPNCTRDRSPTDFEDRHVASVDGAAKAWLPNPFNARNRHQDGCQFTTSVFKGAGSALDEAEASP